MSAGTTAYASASDAYSWGLKSSEVDSATVSSYLLLASRMVDDFTGTNFDPIGTQTYIQNNVQSPFLWINTPVQSVTSVTITNVGNLGVGSYSLLTDTDGTTVGIAIHPNYMDFDLFPATGYAWGYPYGYDVTVVYVGGWASVPLPVKEATIMTAVRRIRERNEVMLDPSITSISVEGYTRTYSTEPLDEYAGLDRRAAGLVEPYRLLKVG